MMAEAVVGGITLGLIILVFAWASYITELQLQSTEFTNAIYAFQILANFDEGAFNEGDANYVMMTIDRGRIEISSKTYNVRITVINATGDPIYDNNTLITTLIPNYRGGWLISAMDSYYRGSSDLISESTIVLTVYTKQEDGARVFLAPRIRVANMGTFKSATEIVGVVNIYIPFIAVGETMGSNPYKLYLQTKRVTTDVCDRSTGGSATITITVNGSTYSITMNCDRLILTILTSEIYFGVRGV